MRLEIVPKHSIQQLSPHINASELRCQCDYLECWYTLYSPDLLDKFEQLRSDCGDVPLHVLSAYRCYRHNTFVGGVLKSAHKVALALDLAVPKGYDIKEFGKKCWKHFDIVIPYKNNKFIHCALKPWEDS